MKRKVTIEFEMDFDPGTEGVVDRHMQVCHFLNSLVGTCNSTISQYIAEKHAWENKSQKEKDACQINGDALYTSLLTTEREKLERVKLMCKPSHMHIDCKDLQEIKVYKAGSYYITDMAHLLKNIDDYEDWTREAKDGHYTYKGYDLFSVYIGNGRYDLNGTKRKVSVDSGYVTMIPEELANKLTINANYVALPFKFYDDFNVGFTDEAVHFGELLIAKKIQ